MSCRTFSFDSLVPVPWRNGGGVTREIVGVPVASSGTSAGVSVGISAGASTRSTATVPFVWRASLASIGSDGPFSVFEGVDRVFTLVQAVPDDDGRRGLRLASADRTFDACVSDVGVPLAFDGGLALDCHRLGPSATALNLMVARGRCRARVEVSTAAAVAQAPSAGVLAAPAGLVYVIDGRWSLEGDAGEAPITMTATQGAWWDEAAGASIAASTRCRALGAVGRLVVARLWPAEAAR